ncbi:nucleotidyltransferase family protein [Algoriphagus limi]|uniref:Nucleotidyltransferase family protein n=1 Tax=Algoriphagus limi TaxID=2975273 RepID=A0ABT2G2I5_9BACT|nr:nucleotidyltransferase family protein [Algoriphagus limi]MCS5489478.1 nucleotidyltransferase family protein [Algoriphagus limi]
MKTGVIILAAGSSSRLGRPKQLIEYQDKTLLQGAVDVALASNTDSVVVVLGWNPELIKAGIETESIDFVVNKNWQEGMASSMQAGLRFLQEKINPDQVILMLCDQPFVNTRLLNKLISKKHITGKGIVACVYSDTMGVPAIFDQKYFEEMLNLKGFEGAKKVILKNLSDASSIDFPEGAIDLDTEEDLKGFFG